MEFMTIMLFLSSFIIILTERKHIMMVMLGMEILVVSLYSMLLISSLFFSNMFCLVFISLAVCEAVMGFMILVGAVRGFGAPKISALFLMKF